MKQIGKYILVLAAFAASSTFAGTQLVLQEIKKGKATGETVTLSVEGDMLRMDNTGGKNASQVIFNNVKKEMMLIDHKEKEYTKMNEAQIAKIAKKMDDAKKQMDAQLAKMPAAQRDMMKSMMGGIMAETKKIVAKLVKTSRTDKAAGESCTITELYLDGKKTQEYCVTAASNFKGSEKVLASMKGMSDMFQKLYESMSKFLPGMSQVNPFNEISKLNGLPIIVIDFEKGKVVRRSELVSVNSKSFDKGFFQVPKKYKENKIDMGK